MRYQKDKLETFLVLGALCAALAIFSTVILQKHTKQYWTASYSLTKR
jgi:hypothetical protein